MMKKTYARLILAAIPFALLLGSLSIAIAPIPTVPQSAPQNLLAAEWDFQAMLPIVFSPITNLFGAGGTLLLSAIFLVLIMGVTWARTGSSMIPLIELVIWGFVFGSTFPADWGNAPIILFVVLPICIIGYNIYRAPSSG